MSPQPRFYYVLGGLTLFLIALHLFISTRAIELTDKNTSLKLEIQEIQNKNRALAVEVERRTGFGVLEKKAKELGFQFPEKVYYLLLPTNEADTP